MDSQRVIVSRGSPRTLAYPTSKVLPNELSQKPPPPILDRYRALLKQRDDELRVSGEDDVLPTSTGEIVHLYNLLLSELTFNSKPIITDLTIIAGEQREHGKGIANAICSRILEAHVDQKLPSLYLLDSIVKNIGREYIRYFSSSLPEVFCEAYRQVHPNLYNSMRHLFGTWSAVFPPSVLHKIEAQLQFSPLTNQQSSSLTPSRASESSRPTHGIHVNPRYLRQLEHSTADSVETQIFSSRGSVGQTPFALGANKLHPSSKAVLAKPSSPSRIGPDRALSSIVELERDNLHRRYMGKASPSHNVFDFGDGRVIGRKEKSTEWRRKLISDDNQIRLGTTTADRVSNGHEHQGPRALIDAYGSDSRERPSTDNSLQVERFDINGIDNKAAPISWQHTEEKEFDWEDMSPTLADRGRSNGVLALSSSSFGFRTRPGFGGGLSVAPVESSIRTNLSGQAQQPASIDSSIVAEDGVSSAAFGHGSRSRTSGFQTEASHDLASRYPEEAWNMSNHTSQPSRHNMNAKGIGSNFQMPLLGRGVPSSSGEIVSPFIDKVPAAGGPYRPPTIVQRIGSSIVDSSNFEARSAVQTIGMRPPVNLHNPSPVPMSSVFPLQKHNGRAQFESINPSISVTTQYPNNSLVLPEQQMYTFGNKELSSKKFPQLGNQNPGMIPLNNFFPSSATPSLPHLPTPPLSQGFVSQGHDPAFSTGLPKSAPFVQLNLPKHKIPYYPTHLSGGTLPPLPPGPCPSTQSIPQSAVPVAPGQPPGSAYSGLIGSLMAQGLISLANQPSSQDSVGIEFNVDILKVRYESAISALYGDLPRQCTTCGLRFKCQEEHSSHMDWHVTKNRMSKNRKQKPSRKWFVSASMWLSGAEALGTEAVPGFLPAETVVEKKEEEELAVPADEDQNVCALCGEPFEDFYSDEKEEWMYKGAVYMNAPDGSTTGMEKSELGPIVHAKCRSESNVAPAEYLAQNDVGISEENSPRKRLRS